MSKTPEEIAQELNDAYDDAVAPLSLEDAIDVAERHASFVESALYGLHEDAAS